MTEYLAEQWKSLICNYIDELNEADTLDKIRNTLLAKEIQQHLLTASTNNADEEKILNKHLAKLKKMTLSDKNLAVIEEMYQLFLKNTWIHVYDQHIESLKTEINFYKLWILFALSKIDYVTPATHVAKLTHSSSGGSSYVDSIKEQKIGFLTTSSLPKTIYDGAYPNASLSKIAKFLLLTLDDLPLGELLKHGDNTPLKGFVQGDELINWTNEFKSRLNPHPKADALAKQIYFKVNEHYHLLIVMKSSALIQTIYDEYFSKEIRKERDTLYKQQEKGKYSEDILHQIPDTLTLSTVMSQPQNVSVNNGSRGGNIRLFLNSPPIWKNQLKPPIHYRSMFNHGRLNAIASENIKGLKKMLITFHNADISFKDPNRLRGITNWVKAISNDIIDYSQILAVLPSGWTQDIQCKLPTSHQIFLDFNREDPDFSQRKKQVDWQAQLVKDFVTWLNAKLVSKDKSFSPTSEHSRVWRDIFSDILREHIDMLEGKYNENISEQSMAKEKTV